MKNFTVNLPLILKMVYLYINIDIPKSHSFLNLPLKSTMAELTEVTLKINELLPQLSDFIDQFNNLVCTKNINVISDVSGNMSIDVPSNMSDAEGEKISRRIGIIDRLITARGEQINHLFQKGLSIETKLKSQNGNYNSQLLDKINEFKRLNASYKH
jgi:hypothetical protein